MRPRWWRHARKTCGLWDPPLGAGRDTHICLLLKDHAERHRCKCGHRWGIWRMSKALKVTRADLGMEP